MSPRNLLPALCLTLAALALLAGCGLFVEKTPASGPTTRPELQSSPGEDELVEKKAQARAAYISYLEAMKDLYVRHGNFDKQLWAENELKGLARIRQYRPTQYASGPGFNIAQATEVDLVEKMAGARDAYRKHLEDLDELVRRQGLPETAKAVARELDGLRQVMQYRYLVLTDLPPARATKPLEKIPAADELFRDGMNYYSHLPVPLLHSKRNMRLALDKFNRLIREYPQSDKVDDALFYAAEILKEYFNENVQAIDYYKRAYQADPETPHPARFQRAVVLDYRLHRRDEALVEYDNVLRFEANRPGFTYKSNSDFAATRIRQLKGE